MYCLIEYLQQRWGVHFAMGGTGALVRGLVGLIEGQGGEVRCNAPVAEIMVEAGRATGVRLASGETIASAIVVSNADSATTYRQARAGRRHGGAGPTAGSRAPATRWACSSGTSGRGGNIPTSPTTPSLLGPRYRELLDDIFKRKVLADDFSLYLHRPTATDPSMAPPGHDAFYVLSPVPNLDSGTDWRAQAEPYRQKIARHLAATILPGLENEIVTSLMLTPQDFQDRLSSVRGAGFGLEPILTQSAWFRPHNRSEDVAGLYLVGAGTHPGAGMPGVITSARVLDSVVPDAVAWA